MTITTVERELIDAVLVHAKRSLLYPERTAFRLEHERHRGIIDGLYARGLITSFAQYYVPTPQGLIETDSAAARSMIGLCNDVLHVLQQAYRTSPRATWNLDELAVRAQMTSRTLALALPILLHGGAISDGHGLAPDGTVAKLLLSERVLDVEPMAMPAETAAPRSDTEPPRLLAIEVDGYRPFARFRASLGPLTVIIGANATGKSSMFDVLRFLAFASSNPLPPEIDPASSGKTLFHAGGPDRFVIAVTSDQGGAKPLRYEIEILGPIGRPRVVRERLSAEIDSSKPTPFLFLDFQGGQGTVRDQVTRQLQPGWKLPFNELALRRALDPNLHTASLFQRYLSSWAFYAGFDVGGAAQIRRPVLTEIAPVLAENGSNLSAVLMWLRTEHPDTWDELEIHLRTAVPGFQSLNVKPRGGQGTVMGTWREEGVTGDLTLADLSDGTLRLLCLATLCLTPEPPPLMCIDEPELGLHPRVLPTVAGLLRNAATRSQVLVATHSPYLLSQFELDEIAIMRKVDGRSEFARPADREGLQREVAELGPAAIAQLHISDELEVRS